MAMPILMILKELIPRKIKANILVTGDVYMEGNLSLNSTMYVLENTTINNANY